MGYTAESGVRNLERSIGSVCRQVAYQYAMSKDPDNFNRVKVDKEIIEEALGRTKYEHLLRERITMPGVAIGLAYTTIGGSALLVETTQYPGAGTLKQTGKLGDVMRESINTSISWIQSNASKIGIIRPVGRSIVESDEVARNLEKEKKIISGMMQNIDLHVHFPAAATPKDGPSAGVTITVALVSLMTARRVRSDFAMTGEISLQGLALPVGGIKEKCMAAHRNGIKNVILPKANKKDVKDVPEDVRKELKIHFADSVHDYLELALEKKIDQQFRRQHLANFQPQKSPIEVLAKL